jgi:7-cyano-7-deazaguanine synthase
MSVLVCLSGGLDSAVVLAMLRDEERTAIGFEYGQPHALELERAEALAQKEGVPFRRVYLPIIPKVNDVVFSGRNAIFASVAAGFAQAEGYSHIAFGCNMSDWGRFPDCRPAFWSAVGEALFKGYGVRVLTPLLHQMKVDVVRHAARLGVVLGDTWSCYAPRDGQPCGKCLACETRIAAENAA